MTLFIREFNYKVIDDQIFNIKLNSIEWIIIFILKNPFFSQIIENHYEKDNNNNINKNLFWKNLKFENTGKKIKIYKKIQNQINFNK